MSKKTQVSLFLIFGIFLLIAVLFFGYINSYKNKSYVQNQIESDPVKLNVNFCIGETAKEALNYIGMHGGYYKMPEPKVTYFWDDMPYYAYKGENKVPTLGEIEVQISDFIKEQLPECVNTLNFEGLIIEGEISSVKSSIKNEGILIHVNYPISVKKGDSIKQLLDFNYEVPTRLNAVYDTALKITQEKLKNEGVLCLDCLVELASANEVFLEVTPYKNTTLIFTIFDNITRVDEDEYIFNFATG